MPCKLSLCLHLSREHLRSCWSPFSRRRLNDFELAQIISLCLYLKLIGHSRITRIEFIWGSFWVWLHHFYIALLAMFWSVWKLDSVTKIRGFFLNVLFGFWFCFCVLIWGKVKLLIKSRKSVIIGFCNLLMPRLFLLKFICLHCIQIKHILRLPLSRPWLWWYDLRRNDVSISVRLSGQVSWARPWDWLFTWVLKTGVTNRSLCFSSWFYFTFHEELFEGVETGWRDCFVVS